MKIYSFLRFVICSSKVFFFVFFWLVCSIITMNLAFFGRRVSKGRTIIMTGCFVLFRRLLNADSLELLHEQNNR